MILAWTTELDQWADHLLAAGRSPHTADTYTRRVKPLGAWAPSGPWSLTSAQLDDWLGRQRWSDLTRTGNPIALRSFYAWAMDQGHLVVSPVAGHGRRTPGPVPASPRSELWALELASFLAWLRAGGRTAGTINTRRTVLRQLSTVVGDPWAVTTSDLIAWLSVPGLAQETRRSKRATVRSFYRWGVLMGRIDRDHNPADGLDPVLVHRALPRPITRDALTAALAVADDRQRLILLLGALAGLRRVEISRLHFRDLIDGQLVIRGKGDHERLVPVHPDVRGALLRERELRHAGLHGTGWTGPHCTADGYLFPSTFHAGPMAPATIAKIVRRTLPDAWAPLAKGSR